MVPLALATNQIVSLEDLTRRIFILRGQRVMLSTDLAHLYGVLPKVLTQAVKRNIRRFPDDFMFQLTWDEFGRLKSQIVTSKVNGRGGLRRAPPYAFTQEGIAMLSSVLRSDRAVQVNIAVMRAFVQLRRLLLTHKELAQKLDALEQKYDVQFRVVFDAIRRLMNPRVSKRRKIGFAQP